METRCHHIGYSFRLAARVLLYGPSHKQDNTYHGLCYTSRGALVGTTNSSIGPPHEGSIRRPIAPWRNALTTELHLAHWRPQRLPRTACSPEFNPIKHPWDVIWIVYIYMWCYQRLILYCPPLINIFIQFCCCFLSRFHSFTNMSFIGNIGWRWTFSLSIYIYIYIYIYIVCVCVCGRIYLLVGPRPTS